MSEQKQQTKKPTSKKGGKKSKKSGKQYVEHNTFTFEEIITPEEKMIMTGVANGQDFDKDSINQQLIEARKVNK